MTEASDNGCLLLGLARAIDQAELFDALDRAVIGIGDMSKTVYVCSKCAVATTVEYPDLGSSLDGMGLSIEDDGNGCRDLGIESEELQGLKGRFPKTTPLLF